LLIDIHTAISNGWSTATKAGDRFRVEAFEHPRLRARSNCWRTLPARGSSARNASGRRQRDHRLPERA
jgi:hypothetical protein